MGEWKEWNDGYAKGLRHRAFILSVVRKVQFWRYLNWRRLAFWRKPPIIGQEYLDNYQELYKEFAEKFRGYIREIQTEPIRQRERRKRLYFGIDLIWTRLRV